MLSFLRKARVVNDPIQPVWIIDEAENLPSEFFRDSPSFLNFAFDACSLITVWLSGHPALATVLQRNAYAALYSSIQTRVQLQHVTEHARFSKLIALALRTAGCTHTLLSDSWFELLRAGCAARPGTSWHRHATGNAPRTEPSARRTA
ncbi:AAA family ATPase [Paraburkholderia sp. B3]|uniref:AAA family ATPase n=1 Tax=Paraburkholderia sp. B3 TaxID=3134791 RepID=UPI0039821005